MFERFAAGAAVASVAIALGALTVMFVPVPSGPSGAYPLTTLWCFVPALWGLWALIAPPSWVPQRLPVWGALLGVIAGTLGVLVLNLPARAFGVQLSFAQRILPAGLIVIFYYLLWLLVRRAWETLEAHHAR